VFEYRNYDASRYLTRLSKILGNALLWKECAIVIKVSFIVLSNVKIWRDLDKPDVGVR